LCRCSKKCKIESGWQCKGSPSSCCEICGDGKDFGMLECDDGNTKCGDG
jgi:hypothetical protein